MRLALTIVTAVLSLTTATACATRMTVSSHVERGLDFSRYHSYDWGPADALPTGDPRLDRDPFFKDRVQGAVEKALAARGFALAAAETPDILIHYHANIRQRLDVNQIDRMFGYCWPGNCPPDVVVFEAGTLVIDVIDAHTNRLIWRGWAQQSVEDLLHDHDRMASTIDDAVNRMFMRLPREPQPH